MQLERVFAFLGLEHQPEAVDYGERFEGSDGGPGDPIGVARHSRPSTGSIDKWAAELAADAGRLDLARDMLDRLDDADLESWGNPRESIWEPLERAGAEPPKKRVVNAYTLQRRVLLALRRDVHRRPHGRVLEKVRYYCDVILRDTL